MTANLADASFENFQNIQTEIPDFKPADYFYNSF
jgi:hypothetical protein